MPRNKIQVRDVGGDYHTFKSDGLVFERDGQTYDVVRYIKMPDGDSIREHWASFTSPMFIKARHLEEQENYPEPQTMTASDVVARGRKQKLSLEDVAEANRQLDKFEEADIAKRVEAVLDHNDLAPNKDADSHDIKSEVDTPEQEEKATQDDADAEQPLLLDKDIPDVDVDAVLAEAEKKHLERPPCETCGGDGTVPDNESEDPLDTVMCPDC